MKRNIRHYLLHYKLAPLIIQFNEKLDLFSNIGTRLVISSSFLDTEQEFGFQIALFSRNLSYYNYNM